MWFGFSRKSRPADPVRSRPSFARPRLESLEDRCLLSAGALDPAFGAGAGYVTTSLSSGSNNYGDHVVVQPDGKLIAVGEVIATKSGRTPYQYGLVRYNTDGSLDTSFGKGGIALGSLSNYTKGYWDLALQPDGKIDVMSGEAWVVYQYNANGTLDTTFGNNGQATIPFSGYAYEVPWDLAIQPPAAGSTEGKIVVVGEVNRNAGVVGVARLNPGGSLDSAFGNGGTVTASLTPTTGYIAWFKSVALQSDGRIVVAGTEGPASPTDSNRQVFVVARYNGDGSLDSSFGPGGIVTTSLGALAGQMDTAVLVQPTDGKIVAVGFGSHSTGGNVGALVRYNPDGSVDTSFGSGGIVTTAGATYRDAALAADGSIVAAGGGFQVARYFAQPTTLNGVTYAAGSLDPTFGSGGIVTTSVGTNDFGDGIAIQPDGKIVVAGNAQVGSYYQFTVLRYLPSEPQVGSFTASPNPAAAGSSVTLTASNITDGNPGATVTRVAFYLDSNGDGSLEPGTDTLLGYATQTSPGVWTFTWSTAGLTAGTYTLFAQATDSDGVLGDPDALTLTVQ